MKLLWDELGTIDISPCNCDEYTNFVARYNQKLFIFIIGLNETYVGVRGNLLMRQHLPTLNVAYAMHSNLMIGQPLPTLNVAYSVLMQKE